MLTSESVGRQLSLFQKRLNVRSSDFLRDFKRSSTSKQQFFDQVDNEFNVVSDIEKDKSKGEQGEFIGIVERISIRVKNALLHIAKPN